MSRGVGANQFFIPAGLSVRLLPFDVLLLLQYLESHSIFHSSIKNSHYTIPKCPPSRFTSSAGFSLPVTNVSLLVYCHTSSQCLWVSVLSRNFASLRIIPHRLSARRVSLHSVIHARKGPAGRIQRDGTVPEDGVRERLVEIDRIPLTITVRQNQRLRDEFVERVRRVARCRDGEEIRIDGLFNHAGAGDGVGHDDVFDLGDVFGRRGRELLVGTIVGDEGGDEKGGAFEGADSGYESRA